MARRYGALGPPDFSCADERFLLATASAGNCLASSACAAEATVTALALAATGASARSTDGVLNQNASHC